MKRDKEREREKESSAGSERKEEYRGEELDAY